MADVAVDISYLQQNTVNNALAADSHWLEPSDIGSRCLRCIAFTHPCEPSALPYFTTTVSVLHHALLHQIEIAPNALKSDNKCRSQR